MLVEGVHCACSCVVRYQELRAGERLCDNPLWLALLQKGNNFFFEEKVYSYPQQKARL